MKTEPNKIFKFSSLALSFLLVISLLSGIFYPDVLIERAYAVTALTNVTDTPTSTKVSTSTSHKIDFTTYTTVPVDGKIVITFPAGFNVASAAFSAWSGFDGNKTVSVSGQVVTVTRTTGGTASTAGGKYITLSGITNTASVNTNYTVTVETQNSAAATLDGPTTSYYFSICANVCHTAAYQIPWSSTVSVSGKHTTKFTTASAIPADGKIKITFPSGFDISGATFDSWSDFDGGRTMAINGQVITITRDNTGTSTAAGAKYIVLNNIVNHSTAGSAYYATLETLTSGDVNIEGPTSIRFSINNTGLGGLADTPKPWSHQNAKAQNRSPYQGPTYGTTKWAYAFGSALSSSWYSPPVIGSDGTIYVPNQTNNKLYAFNTDGTVKWITSDLGGDITGPAINSNGTLYVHVYGRGIYTVDSVTGVATHLFVDQSSYSGSASVMIASDGTILFQPVAETHRLGGLNPDGTLKWKNLDAAQRYGAPSIGSDGTIYFSAQWPSNYLPLYVVLNAVNPDGVTKWQASVIPGNAGNSMSTPAIDDNGVIYLIFGDRVYAINSDGTQKWASYQAGTTGATYGASVGISPDNNTVYYGARDTKFYALNAADGTLKWLFNTGGNMFQGSPMIGADGIIYFNHYKKFYALTSAGDLKWSYNCSNCSQSEASPAIISDGTMYAVTDDGYLTAFQPWTVSLTLNRSDYYNPGDTISFTATTSMLTTDPVTAEANQAQVYLSDGTIVPLTYVSTNSSGNTVWTGTYTISSGKPDGTYTATFEASAVNVETDTTVHFASAPTNTNNTGITSSLSYTVKKQSASAPSLDAPRPSDLPNSPEPVLADPDQKPTPPIASKYNPDGGFDLLLNGGAKETTNPEIALFLFGGPDTKYMQISEDPTFKGATQEKYTSHKHWQLKDNKLGKHTIYIRYFTLYDVPSETVSQSILLTKTTPPSSSPSQAVTPSAPICTTTIIKTGDTLWDLAVRYLTEGSLYPNLISLNKNTYSSLVTNPGYLRLGWKLSVKCE